MTGRGRKTERKVEPITESSSSDSDSSSMTQVPIRYAEPVAGPSGLCGFKRTANAGGAGEKKPKMVPTPSTSSESDSEKVHCSPLGGIKRRDTERLQRAPSRRQGVGHGRCYPDRVPKPNDRLHMQPQTSQKKKCGAQATDPELGEASKQALSQREQVMSLTEKMVNMIVYLDRLTITLKNITKALETLRKAQRPAKTLEEEDGFRAPDLKEDAEDETSSDSQRLKTFQESLEDYWREKRKGNGQFESDSDSD